MKSDMQILETEINMPKIQLRKKSEPIFPTVEAADEISIVEKTTEKFDVRIRFARLKRRMRNRSTNIL